MFFFYRKQSLHGKFQNDFMDFYLTIVLRFHFVDAEMTKIEQQVEQEAKNMNLSTVRLCFQTYLPNENGHFVNCLKPVYSHPIFDSSK